MPIKLANNASTRLAAPITSADTSLTVESGGGDKFPITGDDVFFPMTIVAADGQLEIVKCTARSGDTFNVERAQEGTTAKDFSAGAAVELRFTAGAAEALLDQMEGMIEDAKQDLEDRIDTVEGYKVGDYLTTVRDPGANWLRRDGQLYLKSDYPELSAMLPPLPDGFTFDHADLPPAFNTRWGNLNYVNNRLVIPSSTSGLNRFCVYASTDKGNTWETMVDIEGDAPYRKVAYGNGTYAVATNGSSPAELRTSTDGVTWVSRTNSGLSFYTDVEFHEDIGLFAAIGNNGKIYTSPNGVTWTERTSGVTALLQGVRAIGDSFFVVGSSGTLLRSTNGITWTQIPIGDTASLNDICEKDGVYIIRRSTGTPRGVFRSEDLVNWNFIPVPEMNGSQSQLTASPTHFVTSYSSSIIFSEDGENWNTVAFPSGTGGTTILADPDNPLMFHAFYNLIYTRAVKTTPDQFQTPYDDPNLGWIKAK